MNKKNLVSLRDGGILPHAIPYASNQLHYDWVITVVANKVAQSILGFSIHETRTQCVWNAVAYRVTGIPDHVSDDGSPEFRAASYAKAVKEFAAQSKLASNNTVVGAIEIDYPLADIFVIPSRPLYRQTHPSPKNPPFAEAWRQRGRRFPRD
ncbi:hypothetical protein [Pseudomonas silesiensis]|uniref:hypothetical protein n=1 Tax=Pseudomonas silesiensis TaxID=1853130 RepID=UPI0034D4A6F1